MTITKEIYFSAPPDRVFDALTDPVEITQYFPVSEVVSNWDVGGAIVFKGEAGGEEFTDYGVIENFSRPDRFGYRYWSTNHGTTNDPENQLAIEYLLSAEGEGTKMQVRQSNIKSEDMYQMMNSVVWDSLLRSMKDYIENCT